MTRLERDYRRRGIIRIPRTTVILTTVVEYLWALMVVLNGNSIYHASAYIDYHLLEYGILLTMALLVIYRFTGKIRLETSWVALGVFLALYSVTYLSARQGTMSAADFFMLFVIGLPLLVLLFTQMHQRDILIPLFRKVGDVVCVLAAISLFFWLFGVVLKMIEPNMATVISWGRFGFVKGYYGLHFEVQLDTTFFPMAFLYRNSGIFAEAPMLNLWLNIALAIELFLKSRGSRRRVVLLVVAVFTTMSVTGILFLLLCLLLYLLRSERGSKAGRVGMMMAVILLLALPVLVILIGFSLSLKADTRSYLMRLSDYSAGVKLWLDYPILGSGYGNLRSLQEYMYSPDGVLGFSNSLTAVLGTGGLWVAVLFYIPHFGSISVRWSGDRD